MTKKQMINKLFAKCIEINGLSERKKDKTGNLPTVFINYFGHTARIEIGVHLNGWEPESSSDENIGFYTDNSFSDFKKSYNSAMKRLDGIKNVHTR